MCVKVLCLVNENDLFKKTTRIRDLFFSDEDYGKLSELGEIVRVSEEDVANMREPRISRRMEQILPTVDLIYQQSTVIPEDVFARYPRIKAVANVRGSYPPYSRAFYREALGRGQIFLTGDPAYAPSVAELALGHVINLLRNIGGYHADMVAGREHFAYCRENEGDTSLFGKRVGIVGFGAVGRAFASVLQPFGVRIMAYDPYVSDEAARQLGAQKVELPQLLSGSDVVVLMANPNPSNRQLINAETLGLMKAGALLVNVARSHLVDYAALIEWLRAGKGKAALDVYEKEPLEKDSELRKAPNLVLTPHRAGGIVDSYRRIGHYLLLDFQAIAAGQEPRWMRRLTLENMDVYLS